MMARKAKICISLGKFDPLRQLSWLAVGGGICEIVLDVRAFLALRQYLAWRKAPRNHRCRYCYLILNHPLCVKNPWSNVLGIASVLPSARSQGQESGGRSQGAEE